MFVNKVKWVWLSRQILHIVAKRYMPGMFFRILGKIITLCKTTTSFFSVLLTLHCWHDTWHQTVEDFWKFRLAIFMILITIHILNLMFIIQICRAKRRKDRLLFDKSYWQSVTLKLTTVITVVLTYNLWDVQTFGSRQKFAFPTNLFQLGKWS